MILTQWGYAVDAQELPSILTVEEFDNLTGNRFRGDARTASAIAGALEAARNYCGWHIAPSLRCEIRLRMVDKRVTHTHHDVLVTLPAKFVGFVEEVYIGGKGYTDYVLEASGILRIFDVCPHDRRTEIVIVYEAGLADVSAIKSMLIERVNKALTNPQGISSESTGGVSITYNAAWVNGGNASALATTDRDVLEAYRLQEVF